MNFKDILETLPSIDHLTGLDVLNGETVIHHIPAAPGKIIQKFLVINLNFQSLKTVK